MRISLWSLRLYIIKLTRLTNPCIIILIIIKLFICIVVTFILLMRMCWMSIKNFRLFLNHFNIIFFISLYLFNTQLRLTILLFWANRLDSIIIFIIAFSSLRYFWFILFWNNPLFIWLIKIFGISIIMIILLHSLFSWFWFCWLRLVLVIYYLVFIIYLWYFSWMISSYLITIYFFLRTFIPTISFNTLIILSRIFIWS